MARILLVDDEPQVLDTCKDMLTDEGHDVTAVRDLGEALREAKYGTFDLAITDKNIGSHRGVMPLLAYFRDERQETKVLLFSAEDGERAKRELPCTAFYNKWDGFEGFIDLVGRLTA